MIKVTKTCPLGSQCEKTTEEGIERCTWYTHVRGQNPQTGENDDRWDCAITWLPLLTIESSMTNRGQTHAIESLRNHVASGNKMIQTNLETNNARLPSK